MKKLLFALSLLVLWPSVTFAEDAFNKETKKAVRIGYELFGGYVTDLGIDTSGRMYASTLSSNGIFHSTDMAETWEGSVLGTDIGKINALVVSDEPDTVYVIGGTSLFKTTDGGVNWTELTGSSGDVESNDFSLTLGYSNGVLAVPVRDGSVDVSTDEGETFTNIAIAENVTTTSIVGTSDGSTFYILAGPDGDERTLYVLDVTQGVVTATEQAGNYAWVGVKPTDSDTIVIAGNDGALYTTTGEDGTWQTLREDAVMGEVNFIGDRIYLGDVYTDDLGESFTSTIVTANQLAVDPNDSNTIMVGSGTGVDVSTDGGGNWTSHNEGLLGVTVNDIAQSDNKKIVWLAAQGGLAKSTNFLSDSPTWEYPILPDEAASDMESVWVNPDSGEHLVTGGNSIFVSTDGGATWDTDENLAGLQGTFTDIVSDDDTIYAAFFEQSGDTGTVYMSTDDGSSWTDIGGLNVPVNDLAVLSNGTLIAGAGSEFSEDESTHGIFMYDGSAWEQVDSGTDQTVTSIISIGDSVFAVGIGSPNGKMLRSENNGATWEDITGNGLPDASYFHSITASDENTLYAATGRPAGTSYVYKSVDGGDSWSLLYTGLVDEEFNEMLFDGLMTGTTIGLQSLYSKANIRMSVHGKTLTITLKDSATKDPLEQRRVKLYKKRKVTGSWTYVKGVTPKRTNANGKLRITITQPVTTYYQARWKPNSTDAATYNTAAFRTDRLKVKGAR